MLKAIFFGDTSESSTSLHRANAFGRLGNDITCFNPNDALNEFQKSSLMKAINFRTGYRLVQKVMILWLIKICKSGIAPDLIWVDNGEFFGKQCLEVLKKFNCPIMLYSIDDPTGKRDGMRFDSLLTAVKYYDLIISVRNETAEEFRSLGAKRVLKLNMSYDEVAHHPFKDIEQVPLKFRSEVAFIGTWMRYEKRDEFMLKLIREGINVAIWGDRWEKSKYFKLLKPYYRGPGLNGRDYVAAIQGAKICLGLLSKGNRDLHTTRSLEVPYAGGILCAERTKDHQNFYIENMEAIFWTDAEECVRACKNLLASVNKEKLRLAGMRKVRSLKAGNEDLCRLVLKELNLAV